MNTALDSWSCAIRRDNHRMRIRCILLIGGAGARKLAGTGHLASRRSCLAFCVARRPNTDPAELSGSAGCWLACGGKS